MECEDGFFMSLTQISKSRSLETYESQERNGVYGKYLYQCLTLSPLPPPATSLAAQDYLISNSVFQVTAFGEDIQKNIY